jgi:hypothetical protein
MEAWVEASQAMSLASTNFKAFSSKNVWLVWSIISRLLQEMDQTKVVEANKEYLQVAKQSISN